MNILLITPIYPGPGIGENYTKVVHYFAKEWKKEGENVQVINIPSYFPKIMYMVPKFLKDYLQKKLSATLPTERNSENIKYVIEDVPVFRIPLMKKHPWAMINSGILEKAAENIISELKNMDFHPDVIVGHWFDPTIFFIDYLKHYYKCPTSLVIHNHSFKYSKYIDGPDIWGCRKIDTVTFFNNRFPSKSIDFRCYSGIPDKFFESIPQREWKTVKKFIYVGTLIGRKYPEKIIDALMASEITSYHMSYIGEGALRNKIEQKIKKNQLQLNIELLGRINRDEIIKKLDESDVFIMISKDEVFGLVYLEAMARGCIVIASENEGMEGIIKNDENGFLIAAGDEKKLTETINYIYKLDIIDRIRISKNAISTAKRFSDVNVALDYLDKLKQLKNS